MGWGSFVSVYIRAHIHAREEGGGDPRGSCDEALLEEGVAAGLLSEILNLIFVVFEKKTLPYWNCKWSHATTLT